MPSFQISLGQFHRSLEPLLREAGEADRASGAGDILPLLCWWKQLFNHNGGRWTHMSGTVACANGDGFIEQ